MVLAGEIWFNYRGIWPRDMVRSRDEINLVSRELVLVCGYSGLSDVVQI